ncbi:MAG: hypothetical protein ABL925_07720 [Methylococcales bacterium]
MPILKDGSMANSKNAPLKVALHAMDERSVKTMTLYLKGPCQGAAVVVDEAAADVDIFDGDSINAKKLLAERLATPSVKQVIVLSLQSVYLDDVVSVKKPVKAEDMLGALAEVKARLVRDRQLLTPTTTAIEPAVADADLEKPAMKNYTINTDERNKTSKHRTAMQLNEASFNVYIGNVPGLDVNDPAQFAKAGYRAKDYFQGLVQSAVNSCLEKNQNLQLQTNWRQLVLFAQHKEIWLDADDKQLRAFAHLKLGHAISSNTALSVFKSESSAISDAPEKFHSMEAFIWKLACWTSQGRYPDSIDINHPVCLKNWPNFTRLLITPHAMRIAALLIQEPRTMADLAKVLNIKPQYVFVFASAAHAIGLLGQVRREADELVEAADIKSSPKQGLLGRIISKLRGNKA